MKLCKIQSNCPEILDEFPESRALPAIVDFSPKDASNHTPSMGHSLALQWNTEQDYFQIKVAFKNRPKTKRGLLGDIMTPFDPHGFVSPAMLACELLQREIFPL